MHTSRFYGTADKRKKYEEEISAIAYFSVFQSFDLSKVIQDDSLFVVHTMMKIDGSLRKSITPVNSNRE